MEQRTSKRIPISLEARLISGKRVSKAFIVAVSEKGLYVIAEPGATDRVGNDGWPLTVEFKASPGQTLKLPCKVAWADGHKSGHSLAEMGLEIKDPTPEFKKFYKSSFYKIKTEISHDSIAVIGMACYYPGAPDLKSFWENVLARKRAFRQIPKCRLPLSEYYDPDTSAPDKTYAKRAAVIDGFSFDWVKRGIPKTVVDSSDIVHWLALEVALRSLEDAGLSRDSIPYDRTGVILGNTLTGEYSRSQQMRLRWPYVKKVFKATASDKLSPDKIEELLDSMEVNYKSSFAPITEDTLAGNLSNTIAGRICNFLDLHGGGYTVDGACSSSLIAVTTAANALSSGALDLAIAGGIDISLDTFELIGFAKTNALTTEDMRVYDRRASGFIPGEGAGFVVLKRLQDARADGDYIYAVLKGWGVSSDGKGGMTAPKAQTQALAIRRAYGKAGYGLGTVDFIEGHGTGTIAGDKAELEGIATAMGGENVAPLRYCGITSLKSLIGHTKAASGIGGFIKAVMAVNRRIIPPTAGCSEPNAIFQDKARGVYPVLDGEVRDGGSTVRAGVSGMGFGGINCHVTVESGSEPSEHLRPSIGERELLASYQESELFVIGAGSREEMLERIGDLRRMSDGISTGEMVDLADYLSGRVAEGLPFRAAVVAGVPEDLADCIGRLERLVADNDIPEGALITDPRQVVFVGNAVSRARVGFLFPGQGSQQLNMGRLLTGRHQWARVFMDEADSWLAGAGHKDIKGRIYRHLDRALDEAQIDGWRHELSRPDVAQPAICAASLMWTRYLGELGIKPVAAGGHSLGELTAFRQAGAFDDRTLIEFAAFRGESTSAPDGNPGAMAALACDTEKVEELLKGVDGYAVIANINGPSQTVISGEKAAVEEAVQAAAAMDVKARPLPVGNAFHSRFMEKAASALAGYKGVPETLGTTDLKLFSSTDGSHVKDGTPLPRHFAGQLTHRVDFTSLVKNMAAECDLMVEVGPGRVLSELAKTIIGEGGVECLPVEPRAGDVRALNALVGSYFVRGGRVNWQALYESRLVRPFVPASERSFIENPCERRFESDSEGFADAPAGKDASGPQAQADTASTRGLEEGPGLLIQLASDMTGFPAESIALEHRLLDDLNLDSIKAGQFVAKAIKLYGAEGGQIDPTAMANSSLNDIYAKMEGLVAGLHFARGSSAEEAEAQQFEAQAQGDADNWVRSFRVGYMDEEIKSIPPYEEIIANASKEGRRVLLVSDRPSEGLCADMMGILARNKVEAADTDFSALQGDEVAGFGRYDYVVFLLPDGGDTGLVTSEQVRSMARRMHGIGRVVTTLKSRALRPTYTFVQFGSGSMHGHDGDVSIESRAGTAYLCSLHLENPDERIRALQFPHGSNPAAIFGKIAEEIRAEDTFRIAAYDRDFNRRVPFLEPVCPDAYTKRDIAWNPEDVVLVTGGAKGITAECALKFASEKGVKLALAGSTALTDTDAEIRKALARYREHGIKFRYYACDVADMQSVSDLKKRVEKDLGPITGVIHGAAINVPRRAEQAGIDDALEEIAPKLMGAINIREALKDSPPKLTVGFGSIIGITGMTGNAWYGFANELLNLILQQQKANYNTDVITPAFSVWTGVGMGTRNNTLAYLARMGVLAIPREKGIETFMHLVDHDPGDGLIAVTSRLGVIDSLKKPAPVLPRESRFVRDAIFFEKGVEIEARASLALDTDPYLKDHVFNGLYLFPAVFGVEAMAQAVSAVTGKELTGRLRMENVLLTRPITVEADGETEIRIRALIMNTPEGPGVVRVKAGITVDQTQFARNHFEAEFVLGAPDDPEKYRGRLPNTSLDIIPREDLYGHMLFQGSLFQRISAVRSIADHTCVFDSHRESGAFVTEDPYFRDTLLQSVQIILPDLVALPVEIKRWDIMLGHPSGGENRVVADLLEKGDESVVGRVTAVDSGGAVVERLVGYKAKVMEMVHGAPGISDLKDPDAWDERRLNDMLRRYSEEAGIAAPSLSIRHVPGMHGMTRQKRHSLEKALFANAYRRLKAGDEGLTDEISVAWTKDGKPFARDYHKVGLSCSHDERLCICTAGIGRQGCDIEPLTGRGAEDWKELLGRGRAGLFDNVASMDSSSDRAGSRIWCALEAARKAAGAMEDRLRFVTATDGCFVFEAGGLSVLTFPARLLRGRERMVAIAATKEEAEKVETAADTAGATEVSALGPQGQRVFTCRLPLGLRDSATVTGGVYFASWFHWVGKVREMALKPISRYIAEEFHNGHYMATNFTGTDISGQVGNHENIEACVRVDKLMGDNGSSLVLNFDWRKIMPDYTLKTVATSRHLVSWIRVLSQGEVEPVPAPAFFTDFLKESCLLPQGAGTAATDEPPEERPAYDGRLGRVLYEGDVLGNGNGLLAKTIIDTTTEHSDLAQNIYFSNYATWQGHLRDRYLFNLSPDMYRKMDRDGQFVCVRAHVKHLREALPFDRIYVTMKLSRVYECGLLLYFEYFKAEPEGKKQKLAYGEHTVAWAGIDGSDDYLPQAMPAQTLSRILSVGDEIRGPHR